MPTTPLEIVKAFLKAMEPLDYSTAGAMLSFDCKYTNLLRFIKILRKR